MSFSRGYLRMVCAWVIYTALAWAVKGYSFQYPARQPSVAARGELPITTNAFSPSRQFSLEIDTDGFPAEVKVFRHDRGEREFFWKQSIDFHEIINFTGPLWPALSNDGKHVILRPDYTFDGTVLVLLGRNGGRKEFHLQDFEIKNELLPPSYGWTFAYVLDGKPSHYGVWLGNRWRVIRLKSGRVELSTRELTQRLNALALNEAKAIINEYWTKYRRPEISAEGKEELFTTRVIEAFRFLGREKSAETKAMVEPLLTIPIKQQADEGPYLRAKFHIFEHFSSERALGDEILGNWQSKDYLESTWDNWWGLRRFHILGGIHGRVELPFRIPNRPGKLWVYLIPVNQPATNWHAHPQLIGMRCDLPDWERSSSIEFYFGTITPGQYRLKSIWDRQDTGQTFEPRQVVIGGPGDYESDFSSEITVGIGGLVTNIVLNCANRSAAGEDDYKADELWRKQFPREDRDYIAEEQNLRRKRDIIHTNASQWVTATVKNDAQIRFSRLKIPTSEQIAEFNIPISIDGRVDRKPKGDVEFKAILGDSHGCRFLSDNHGFGNSLHLFFEDLPRDIERFTLRVLGFQDEKQISTSEFKIRIPWARGAVERLKADPFPQERRTGPIQILLRGIVSEEDEYRDKYESFYRSRPDFEFSEPGWEVDRLEYRDSWGNKASDPYELCRNQQILKLEATFKRNLASGKFLPEERLELNLPKAPGEGETIPFNLKRKFPTLELELVALAGPGTFEYLEGADLKAVAAKTERLGRRLRPDIRVNRHLAALSAFSGDTSQPNLIEANTSFVLLRVSNIKAETRIHILPEFPRIVWGPSLKVDENPATIILPVDLKTETTNPQIICIVQQLQKTEFVIDFPRRHEPATKLRRKL